MSQSYTAQTKNTDGRITVQGGQTLWALAGCGSGRLPTFQPLHTPSELADFKPLEADEYRFASGEHGNRFQVRLIFSFLRRLLEQKTIAAYCNWSIRKTPVQLATEKIARQQYLT